jgi:branched-chain amino acid transport system permease protein
VVFLLHEEILPELMHVVAPNYAENWMIIFGPILIAVVLFARGGLMGLVQRVLGGRQ